LSGSPARLDTRDHADIHEWDEYWSGKSGGRNRAYDAVAEFYRVYIIRPIVNTFVGRFIPNDGLVLHAGCGGGQVDTGIRDHVQIIPLDLSLRAIKLYRAHQGQDTRGTQGSIFALPFRDDALDGIYNLGVMEHFTEAEIVAILTEFRRALKPGAHAVLFWPPVYGLSARFLDGVHFVMNQVLKRPIKLHPDEITRVRSREQVKTLCERSGLRMVAYYFGLRDIYTHAVIALKKDG
jgi:SAM-dependent methyltransferase